MLVYHVGQLVCKNNTVAGKVVKTFTGCVLFCSEKSLIVEYSKDGVQTEEFVNLVRGFNPWFHIPSMENK